MKRNQPAIYHINSFELEFSESNINDWSIIDNRYEKLFNLPNTDHAAEIKLTDTFKYIRVAWMRIEAADDDYRLGFKYHNKLRLLHTAKYLEFVKMDYINSDFKSCFWYGRYCSKDIWFRWEIQNNLNLIT